MTASPARELVRRRGRFGRPSVLIVDCLGRIDSVIDVVQALLDSGTRVIVATPRGAEGDPESVALPLRGRRQPEMLAWPRIGSSADREAIQLLRAVATAAAAHSPLRASARTYARRSAKKLWKRLGPYPGLRDHLVPGWSELSFEALVRALWSVSDLWGDAARSHPASLSSISRWIAALERSVAPPAAFVEALVASRPDAVLVVSRLGYGGIEPDVVKAARASGVPSALLVWSWDNLSSKALLVEHPDRLFVWNDRMAREAHDLHGVDAERVHVLGAANFDRFFSEVATHPQGRAHEILYLGSSTNVVPDELPVFRRWLEAVRAREALARAPVAVRPHPSAPLARCREWEHEILADGAVRFSPGREATLARDLASARVAVAVNTSAEIEAAIAGVPVLTFRVGDEAPGQQGTLHYSYLLEDEGGFVREAASVDEHVAQLEETLRTTGDGRLQQRALESFIRPHGLDRAVSPLVARAIVDLATDRGRRQSIGS